MLILTRKIGESIMIGDGIVITILGIKGCQAKVGIEAAKEIPVHREEIYERIKLEEINNNKNENSDDKSTS